MFLALHSDSEDRVDVQHAQEPLIQMESTKYVQRVESWHRAWLL